MAQAWLDIVVKPCFTAAHMLTIDDIVGDEQPFESRRALAVALGVTPQAVSQWSGRPLPAERVIGIARASGWRLVPHKMRPDIYPNFCDGLPSAVYLDGPKDLRFLSDEAQPLIIASDSLPRHIRAFEDCSAPRSPLAGTDGGSQDLPDEGE